MAETDQNIEEEAFDAFALLGLERRLALEDDAIDTHWRTVSRELHPDTDRGDAERAVAANLAHQTLRSITKRLRHWLELHGIELQRQTSIDPLMMDLFTEVGTILAEADNAIKLRAAASSALAKALLTETEISAQQKIQGLLGKLQGERIAVTDRFPGFDQAAAESQDFTDAIAATGTLGFLEKWEHQVQQRLMGLIAL